MQRYRVNYPLLIGLAVGSFLALVGSFFLWKFQVNRNAVRLLDKADVAEAEGNLSDAYDSLAQYTRLRRDDPDGFRRLGDVSIKLATDDDVELKVRYAGYQSAIDAVKFTDDLKLRRELVDMLVKYGVFDLALQNIDELLDKGQGDADLKATKAQCLFAMQNQGEGANWCYKMIGYDPKAGKFDATKAEAPNKPVVYALLAQYLRGAKQNDVADRVINQMVAANKDSREAYVLQYQFLRSAGDENKEKAREALEKAYKLEPTDASVLADKGFEALSDYAAALTDPKAPSQGKNEAADKHLAEAEKYFGEALERYPDRIGFYEQVAKITLAKKEQKEALAVLDKGLEKFPPKSSISMSGVPTAMALFNMKVDILLEQKDFDGVKELVKDLRSWNNDRVTPIADFNDARLLAISEKWKDAADRLADVKGRLLGFSDLQAMASTIEGFCRTQLGQYDLAYQAYKWALDVNPNLPQAQQGLRSVQQFVGPDAATDEASSIDKLVRDTLNQPKDKQDWTAVAAKIDAVIDQQAQLHPEKTWAASRKAYMRGQTFATRAAAESDPASQKQLLDQARTAIREANNISPNDPAIQMAVIQILATDPDAGPKKALAKLDEFVTKGKDGGQWRALRVELLAKIHADNLPQQLEDSVKGIEKWPAAEQAMVWSAIAARYEQLGKFADAQRCIEKTVDLSPNNLPVRFVMFDLALKQGDDAAMRRAQSRILEIVKSENDPSYVLSEVKRRMVGQSTGASNLDELKQARKMLTDAIKQRQTYSDLYVASGQLYMMLEKNTDQALASFSKAIELGAQNLNAIALQIRLLADHGRLQEARKMMDKINPQAWSAVLERTAADVLLGVGETDKAFAEAEKLSKSKSEDLSTQLWFAELASKVKKPEASEAALKKATVLNPSEPEVWTRLVGLYIQLKKPELVEKTLRQAHLALDEEYLPLLTGKYYELQSRWQEAEDIYLAAYVDRGDDIFVARRLAEFYLTWASANPANKAKAAVYLNRILHAANEGKLAKDDPNGPWARRQAARLLSQSQDYQDSLKAERLLADAIAGGVATPEDQDLLVDVLSSRQDPGSRQSAVELLRQIRQQRGLTWSRELQMGHILAELGDWEGCKKQLEDAIGRFPTEYRLQTAYISLLIQHKEYSEAQTRIARLEDVKEIAPGLSQLKLEMAAALGKKADVRATLTGMTPNLRSALTADQVKFIHDLAELADSVGDHEYALALMREYARRAKGSELELARMTALYGNIDEGFTMLRQLMNTQTDEVIESAIGVLHVRRAEAPAKIDEEVSRIVRQGLRDDPENAKRLMLEAEMLETQEKYPESIEAYKRMLARDDVPKNLRASAANNLAFLVALQDSKPEDLQLALKYVNEAIEVMGPLSDILDTRALIYISLGQYADAVADMQTAVKMNVTPSKWFHLAQAQLGAGDQKGAKATWDLAKQQGFKPDSVPKSEQGKLQQFMKKMESVGLTPQL